MGPGVRADGVLAWIAIGAAASLAGMIWPFRRGTLGVVVNLLAGTSGAVIAGLVGCAALPEASTVGGASGEACLFFAALGAVAALGIVHAAWTRVIERRLRHAP